jgi:hypothetical protein
MAILAMPRYFVLLSAFVVVVPIAIAATAAAAVIAPVFLLLFVL